jgi:hypothetical protein
MLSTPRSASIRIGGCIRRQIAPFRQRRSLHKVLTLPYAEFAPEQNGIYPLYSREGFAVAWQQKQTDLINTVNRITAGTTSGCEYWGLTLGRHGDCARGVVQLDCTEL